ncbi:MAG: hypothetical protein ACMUJM_05370 [bacterium]
MSQKIKTVIKQVEEGLYFEAIDKLENDILGKISPCIAPDIPDKKSWIIDCPLQNHFHTEIPLITDLLMDI